MKTKAMNWLSTRYWSVLALVILGVVLLQFYEASLDYSLPINVFEVVLYVVLLLANGMIIDLLVKATYRQNHSLKILGIRQKINHEIMAHEDWDGLTRSLVKLPREIAPVEEAGIFVYNPVLNQFRMAAHWVQPHKAGPGYFAQNDCVCCLARKSDTEILSSPCLFDLNESPLHSGLGEYCFPMFYAGRPLAILRLIHESGAKLDENQVEIFQNICDVMAVALKTAQDRQALAAMRSAETSLDERRKLSQYLHDSLGPNLGYMRLKLDQLIAEESLILKDQLRMDLLRLRDAAADSNEILRKILVTTHPETIPVLTNLLREYAHKVSHRAKFDVDFHILGEPRPISQEIGQTVFFAFQELLSNVEKYAQASRVSIEVKWAEKHLEMKVTDNGKGFNLAAVNHEQHFGLDIMRERIDRVHGKLDLVTAENAGTAVTISLPGLVQESQDLVSG